MVMKKHKDYHFSEKIVKIGGDSYRAVFPDKHSTIQGIILHTYDQNANDSWANIRDYQTACYILWKGSTKWQKEYEGKTRDFKIRGKEIQADLGDYLVVFALENEKIIEKHNKKYEIQDLKREIKEKQKRLEELLHH